MPFCKARITSKWKPSAYPKTLNHIGDHLRARRMDMGLRLHDVAQRLGVHAASVRNWESGWRVPAVRLMGAVVEFLGYDPRPKEETVGERLGRYRERGGWSRSQLAEFLGLSESVVWRWESGRRKPTGKHLARVVARLGGDAGTAPSTIGGQLRQHRWRLELTLTGMASLLGVAQSTLCRWESGEREPKGVFLARVEAVLGSKLEQGPAQGR